MFGREKKTRRKEKKKCCVFFLETRKRNCDRYRHLLNEETLKKILFVVFLFLFLSRSNEDERNQLLNGVEGEDSGYNLQPGRNFFKNVDSLFDLVNQRGDFHYPILKENRETHTHTNMSSSTLFTRANVGIVSKLIEQSKQNKIIFSFIPERF